MYVHNIDPFAIQFTETFGIRWYGLAYLSGLAFGYAFIVFLAKKGKTNLSIEHIGDFVTYCALGVMGGGRLGYCLFYAPDLLTRFGTTQVNAPVLGGITVPTWGVLEVMNGGMSSHGGMLGVALACLLFARKHSYSFKHLFDLTVIAAALAFFCGRLANFVNGELYGREIREPISWAVKFPQEMSSWPFTKVEKLKSLGPVVESLSPATTSGGQTLITTANEWSQWSERGNSKVYAWINHLRARAEVGDQKVLKAIAPVLTARYPSQLIQALLEGLLVFIALNLVWLKPRKPGVLAACFGIFYAIARIAGEYYRLPDAHLGFQALGLTRGQWLSVALLALGFFYLYVASRSKDEPIGGLS